MRKFRAPPSLVYFACVSTFLAGLSVVSTLVMALVFQRSFPYGLPLFGGLETFNDFTIFSQRFAHLQSPEFWLPFNRPFTYPAAAAAVFAIFFSLPLPLVFLLLLYISVVAWGVYVLVRRLVEEGCSAGAATLLVSGLVLECWPLALLISRANIEGIDALLLAIGVVCVLRDKNWTGASFVGLAGAMKLFPIILLALLLGKKKYKEVAWGLFVGVASTVLSLAYLGPSLMDANRHIADGLDFFRREYAEQVSWIGYDHSLFALYKFVTLVIADNGGQPFASDLKLYMPITAIFGLVIYMARIRVLPILNQVIALTAFSVLLPPVSYDYTLVHLLLPCGLLMVYAAETWRRKEAVSGLRFLFGCFAVIFTWGTFLNFEGVRVAGQIRSVAMVFLLAGVLLFPFPQAKVDQVSTARS